MKFEIPKMEIKKFDAVICTTGSGIDVPPTSDLDNAKAYAADLEKAGTVGGVVTVTF